MSYFLTEHLNVTHGCREGMLHPLVTRWISLPVSLPSRLLLPPSDLAINVDRWRTLDP